MYIDLFVIIPIAVASESGVHIYFWIFTDIWVVGRTLPYPKIHPKRPTASLVSKKVLTSIIGQILINSAFQILVFFLVRRESWYTAPDVNNEKLETFNYENTSLFLLSCFQYILVAGVFSVGPPYRKPMYTNRMFYIKSARVCVLLTLVSLADILPCRSRWILNICPSFTRTLDSACARYHLGTFLLQGRDSGHCSSQHHRMLCIRAICGTTHRKDDSTDQEDH